MGNKEEKCGSKYVITANFNHCCELDLMIFVYPSTTTLQSPVRYHVSPRPAVEEALILRLVLGLRGCLQNI